jgi:peptidoglycan/LPS O-acetylase OafA/YrhL
MYNQQSMKKIPELDGIRGLAIAAVLLGHCNFFFTSRVGIGYLISKALSPGWIGVNIFFVLSGYLITGILIDTKANPRYFTSFYARRALRIFPLYFGALAVAFLVLPSIGLIPRTPWSEQIWYWSYLYNWRAAAGFGGIALSHFWSLAVEEQFYMIWPLIIYLMPSKRLPLLFAGLIFGSFLYRIAVIAMNLPVRYDYFTTPARTEDLCVGALIAYAMRNGRMTGFLSEWTPAIAKISLASLVVCTVISGGFEPNKPLVITLGTSTTVALAAVAIVTSRINPSSRIAGFLRLRTLRWLGAYSYGIYIVHVPLQELMQSVLKPDRHTGGLMTSIAASVLLVSCSCGLAFLSYHYYESRFLKLKHRFETAKEVAPPVLSQTLV